MLASDTERIATLGRGEPVGMVTQEVRYDVCRAVDDRRREPHPVALDDEADGARTAKPPGLVTSCKGADRETAETWAWACEVERCIPAAMSGWRGALSSAEVSAEEFVEEVIRFGLVSSVEGVRGLNCDEESRCM